MNRDSDSQLLKINQLMENAQLVEVRRGSSLLRQDGMCSLHPPCKYQTKAASR